MRTFIIFVIVSLFLFPSAVFAYPVISEVMWMGTDLSTADEWIEIYNPDLEDVDLSGWSFTSMNSSAKEIASVRFATGAIIHAGEYLVLSNKNAASSRLLSEPFAVSSILSLPNTKLLLRLRDATNAVIDEVDDGVGAPFAGDNPSGTGAKASMDRIDVKVPGNLKENWRTSTKSLGFDTEGHVFGTPGLTSDSDFGNDPDTPPPDEDPLPIPDPVPPPCVDPLEIAIAVQSGLLFAVGKATVNFQAVATIGTLTGVSCSWNYGDGFLSESCNPPVHSFVSPGTYNVRLEAKNQCGNTLTQEQVVEVQAEQITLSNSVNSSSQPQWYDGSRLVMLAALPNPEGTDTGKEWVDIKNLEEKGVDLRDWKLSVGATSIQSYILKGSIGALQTLRLYDSELKFKLPNTASELRLMTPSGSIASTIPWKTTDEGRVYLPSDIRSLTVRGRVAQITSPTTFILELAGDASSVLGRDIVHVRILGVSTNNSEKNESYLEREKFLRALIENKNIELKFSTELWDDAENLLAHVFLDNSTSVEQTMINSLLWAKTTLVSDVYREEDVKEPDISKIAVSTGVTIMLKQQQDLSEISISEIYPSPFPENTATGDLDWKNREWIEFENTSHKIVDLSGYFLTTSKSKKALPEGLKIGSGSYVIFYTSEIGLGLRNSGETISLVSPDYVYITSLVYPAIKNGISFIHSNAVPCLTIQPTPGAENTCLRTISKISVSKKVSSKTLSTKKVSAKVKRYVASYRAQVDDDPITNDIWLTSEEDKAASPAIAAIFSFLIGLGAASVLFLHSSNIRNFY